MLKNNYHTHMKYCNHADGDVIDYVNKAIELNFSELGMSDHAPIPFNHGMNDYEYEDNYCKENMSLETFNRYLGEIDDAQAKNPNIKLYKALESEYLDNNDDFYKGLRSKLDYMILGIHFYTYKGRIINTYKDINYDNVLSYLENAKKALSTGLFSYFAHPDLFFFEYKDKNGNQLFDERCVEVTEGIIDLAVKYNVPIEVNCNGIKYAKNKDDVEEYRYPYIKFWEIVKNYQAKNPGKLKVVIGADSHTPDALDCENVEKAISFTKKLGLVVEEKLDLK